MATRHVFDPFDPAERFTVVSLPGGKPLDFQQVNALCRIAMSHDVYRDDLLNPPAVMMRGRFETAVLSMLLGRPLSAKVVDLYSDDLPFVPSLQTLIRS